MIETYARIRGGKMSVYLENRGFQNIKGENTSQYLNLQFLRDSATNVKHQKLHGSLDWSKRDDGKIITSSDKPLWCKINRSDNDLSNI